MNIDCAVLALNDINWSANKSFSRCSETEDRDNFVRGYMNWIIQRDSDALAKLYAECYPPRGTVILNLRTQHKDFCLRVVSVVLRQFVERELDVLAALERYYMGIDKYENY